MSLVRSFCPILRRGLHTTSLAFIQAHDRLVQSDQRFLYETGGTVVSRLKAHGGVSIIYAPGIFRVSLVQPKGHGWWQRGAKRIVDIGVVGGQPAIHGASATAEWAVSLASF